MEAKDTLLTPEEMVPMKHKWEIRDKQAEISFKAGIRVGYSAGVIDGQHTNHKRHGKKMVQARQDGIREVVEWIKAHPGKDKHTWDEWFEWQAKLKEWNEAVSD